MGINVAKIGRGLTVAGMLSLAACLGACSSGSDGAAGAPGAAGATGATGAAAPGASAGESCSVCHGTSATLGISVTDKHPDPSNKDLVITDIKVTTDGTNHPVVAFHVEDEDGNPVDFTAGSTVAASTYDGYQTFRLGDLIPANTGSNTYSTDYYEMWDAETPGQGACAADTYYHRGACTALDHTDTNYATYAADFAAGTPATGNLTLVTDGSDGNYTYTFSQTWGTAWPGYNNADYDATNSHRVVIELSSPPDGYNKGIGVADFTGEPADAAAYATNAVDSPRQFVTIQACRKCHGPLMDGAAHADNRNDMRACDMCHSVLYGSWPRHAPGFMADANADLPVFIHAIHDSMQLTGMPTVTYPVTYPQDIRTCTTCHSDPSGAAPGDLTELDNWKTNPSVRVCTSCHDVTFTGDSPTHSGGAQVDADCHTCHPATGTGVGKSVTDAHATTAATADTPEFDVTVTVSAPANAVDYVDGETPVVTVTLKNHSDGTAVNPAFYTTAAGAKGDTTDTALSSAELFVYGPRAYAVPVLTPGSSTDSTLAAGTAPTQGVDLLDATDANVTSDATGFHYQLQAIPAGMTAGTYMVQFQGADYGGVSSTDYVTGSTGLTTIKINTATDTNKVSGDACTDCHGATRMHLTGSHAHNVPFDTDYCLACHDHSGNHGDYIGNRVHAVHSANSDGDLTNYTDGALVTPVSRDWSDVTFPVGSINPASYEDSTYLCMICHTSGATTYKTKPYASPCIGCHGEATGATSAHMLQNGADF